ncbi:MAG: oligopeptide transporter, OPT family [Deltaproteobacteria bacterium]|nr:oligopeptide transporter, OPT family [Deltaproteobacteria bacterium]
MSNHVKPYVDEHSQERELTVKAILLGLIMAVVLGAANAYLGLKAGMTIAASFPAAVIAIAAFRIPFLRGSILEQNIARTTASVGEALVAGAIFTIPAFLMASLGGQKLWTHFHYWETTIILLVGGLLGTFFVILLRRTLVVDADLPFPEGHACFEIVKAGQKGETGASLVFGSMGIAVIIELFKNTSGFPIIQETREFIIGFPKSVIHHFNTSKEALGNVAHQGMMLFQTPLVSPALISVGYIIGPKYSSINLAGGVLAWLVFIPLAIFLDPDLSTRLAVNGQPADWSTLAYSSWYNHIRPIAVGAMLVGSFKTLWGLRSSLKKSFSGVFSKKTSAASNVAPSRLERDLNPRRIFLASALLLIPMIFVYHHFTQSIGGAIVTAIIMVITGFLFSAVGGWLVGIVGNSNQPVSGLTLSALIIAALVMIAIGLTGLPGVAAVLGVAAIVCCAACLSGDMIQDLKIGQLIGGTPWKMELAEIIGVIVVSFFLVFPMIILHEGNIAAGGLGIGDLKLPAPQAGLMAQLATGIVGGDMPWALVVFGMFFSLGLLLIEAPSPMLIAVGMYLPFETTFAIFVGGVMKWLVDRWMNRKQAAPEERLIIENRGTLIASGLIAGEALTGVALAALTLVGIPSLSAYFFGVEEPALLKTAGGWLAFATFGIIGYCLMKLPMRRKV